MAQSFFCLADVAVRLLLKYLEKITQLNNYN